MNINDAKDHLKKILNHPKICQDCKTAVRVLGDAADGYMLGMSPNDYARVQQWVGDGMKLSPETAFTSGPSRQAARLIQYAMRGRQHDKGTATLQ